MLTARLLFILRLVTVPGNVAYPWQMNANGNLVGSAPHLGGAALFRLGALREAVYHPQVVQGHVAFLAHSQIGNDFEDDAKVAGNPPQAIHLPGPLAHIVALDLRWNPATLQRVQGLHYDTRQSVAHVALMHVDL